MTFFNKKTEVMKVELTPLGRYKLSIGKLKPHHYRFFDNNVIYDGKAIGISEVQNDADNRIRQETPILKQNPNITGVETSVKIIETDDITVQTEEFDLSQPNMVRQKQRKNKRDDHINQLVYNIGTIEPDSDMSPSFKVDAFRGELSASSNRFYSSANIQTSSIPQVDLRLHYKAYVTYSDELPTSFNFDLQTIGPFEDGSQIIIESQNPLLRIKEAHSFDEKENFHISAYRVFKQNATGSLVYEKMSFKKKSSPISNGLYVGDTPEDTDLAQQYDPDKVPYYFDLLVDKEISESDYCETIGDLKIRNIYLDDEVICPDQIDEQLFNIYESNVTPEDLEDCD